MKTVYGGLGSILFKRKKFSCSNFWLDDACLPANDVQDRKFPAPTPYALKALTPAVVISKLDKLLMPSHVMLFVFTVVLGTGTTVTRTPGIPSSDSIAFLRSDGVALVNVLLHMRLDLRCFPITRTLTTLRVAEIDPAEIHIGSLSVFCTLVWWLRRGSILRCLGGIPLSLTQGVHASRSSVHAPSRSLLCDCPVDQTQLCAQKFVRPALLPVCSDTLSSARRYLSFQRTQPAFLCTGRVRTSWRNPV